MSIVPRRTLFTLATILAVFFTAPAAQSQQSQVVMVHISVPLTLQNLNPEIKQIALKCDIFGGHISSTRSLNWRSISTSTYTGTISDNVQATVTADKGGQSATYNCVLKGRATNTGGTAEGFFSPAATDLRFKVQSAAGVGGSFVW